MCSYSNKVYLCTAEGDFKQQNCIRQKLFRNRKYAKYKIHLANEKLIQYQPKSNVVCSKKSSRLFKCLEEMHVVTT